MESAWGLVNTKTLEYQASKSEGVDNITPEGAASHQRRSHPCHHQLLGPTGRGVAGFFPSSFPYPWLTVRWVVELRFAKADPGVGECLLIGHAAKIRVIQGVYTDDSGLGNPNPSLTVQFDSESLTYTFSGAIYKPKMRCKVPCSKMKGPWISKTRATGLFDFQPTKDGSRHT